MDKPRTVPEIIDACGGTHAFSRLIDVKPSAAGEMKRRGNIGVKYWPKVIEADLPDEAGGPVTYEELVAAHLPENRSEAAA